MIVLRVPRRAVEPNPWNPNEQSAFTYAKELESIREFGFIDPILVRELGAGRYQIIDGEHRWRATGDLGLETIDIVTLGVMDDVRARRLTITMNELRGTANPGRMADLLAELAKLTPLEELIEQLPFTREAFDAMTGLGSLPPLPGPAIEALAPAMPGDAARSAWVERTYRLPRDAAEVLDEALAVARGEIEGDCPDWQALEFLAAELLATYVKR